MPGPIPNRSDQRVRRNKPEVPITKVAAIGVVSIPDLGIPNPHPIVADLYESMRQSAQSKWYEASDWGYARLTMLLLDEHLKSEKRSAMMIASINQMLTSLLLTEGDRRRVRMEIERGSQEGGEVVAIADLFRQRLQQG